MSQKKDLPPFAVFPNLNFVLRLPTGVIYRGKLRQHPSREVEGEVWYEGYANSEGKEQILADTLLKDQFAREAGRPAHFHPDSNVEPLRVKLNRLPMARREDKNRESYVSNFWTPDGLWTIVCGPSKSEKLINSGRVEPAREELAFAGSRIRQYQTAPDEADEGDTMASPAPAQPSRGARAAGRHPK